MAATLFGSAAFSWSSQCRPASGLHRRLEVVPPSSYGVAQCPEQRKNQSNHEHDHSD
jgi:hypothetical protein